MPLSLRGIDEATEAARDLNLRLDVLDAWELHRHVNVERNRAASVVEQHGRGISVDSVASLLVASGGTIHFPSVVVHRDGRIIGSAILGYKTAAAYRHVIGDRVTGNGVRRAPDGASSPSTGSALERHPVQSESPPWSDISFPGPAGAYFRWVPGTEYIALEMKEKIYLLDLTTGRATFAPGYVDFIPSPDGKLFVTPKRNEAGLEFYDARKILLAADAHRSATGLPPRYVDPSRPDQYPSIGILSTATSGDSTVVTYRVLTAWFDRAAFRDYRVSMPPGVSGEMLVRPAGPVVPICPGQQLSLPMLSKDGREAAGRDESTGTTKIFRVAADGRCEESLDLGIPTGKITFDGSGRRIAFAIPRGSVPDAIDLTGVYVLDRRSLLISRLAGEEANGLAFPEFIGTTGLIFLLDAERPSSAEVQFRFVRDPT
jgi:hypothetical protein